MSITQAFALGAVMSSVLGVLAGILIGRLQSANRQVDRILREETRFRHPAGSKPGGEVFVKRVADLTDADAVRLGVHPSPRAESVSVPPFTPRSGANPSERIETVSETLRRHSAILGWTGQLIELESRADKRAVCGKPVTTNLGEVQCLMPSGHAGSC